MRSRTGRKVAALAVSALAAALVGTVGTSTVGAVDESTSTLDSSATTATTAALVAPAAAPVAAVTNITSLPLLSVALTIEVTTGPGGELSSIAVNPADGFTATNVKPNRVAFVNDAGTARIVVKSREGGQRVEAKAGSLAEVSGAGSWSGDVFENGTITHVTFVIGAGAGGGPDITGVTVDDPTAVIGATEYGDDDGDDGDDERSARVKIQFVNGSQTRSLSIKVETETESDDDADGDDDQETHAKVRVSLSRIKNVAVAAETLVGPQRWDGVLCDGSAASITYVIADDGTLNTVVVTPPTAEVDSSERSIKVSFETGERVRIKVKNHDGLRRLEVNAKIRCDRTDPTVNTPISDDSDDDDDDGKNDRKNDRNDGDEDNDDQDNSGEGDESSGESSANGDDD